PGPADVHGRAERVGEHLHPAGAVDRAPGEPHVGHLEAFAQGVHMVAVVVGDALHHGADQVAALVPAAQADEGGAGVHRVRRAVQERQVDQVAGGGFYGAQVFLDEGERVAGRASGGEVVAGQAGGEPFQVGRAGRGQRLVHPLAEHDEVARVPPRVDPDGVGDDLVDADGAGDDGELAGPYGSDADGAAVHVVRSGGD